MTTLSDNDRPTSKFDQGRNDATGEPLGLCET
jgi:hypothetical protein